MAMKLQIMTLTALLIFVVMFAIFFAFVIIDIQHNQTVSASAVSQSYLNIVQNVRVSAQPFGVASAKTAISVLGYYLYNSTLSAGNIIYPGNDISYMMTNGMLPFVPSNTIAGNFLRRGMGSFTFNSYNASILSNFSNGGLYFINETGLSVTLPTAYAVAISYIENLKINQTNGVSTYSIPINFTISLNGTNV